MHQPATSPLAAMDSYSCFRSYIVQRQFKQLLPHSWEDLQKGMLLSFGHAGSLDFCNRTSPDYCDEVALDSGAIFNFDFAPDGSTLAVACEKKSVILMNSLNR